MLVFSAYDIYSFDQNVNYEDIEIFMKYSMIGTDPYKLG